jgi:hypothetical protein
VTGEDDGEGMSPDRAVCAVEGCTYVDPDGSFARDGRKYLRKDLIRPAQAAGDAEGFTAAQADGALRHVTDRVAVLYFLGKIYLQGHYDCNICGSQVLDFVDSPASTAGTLARGTCPFHPDGRMYSGEDGTNAPAGL